MFHLIEHGYLCFLCWQRKYDFHVKNKAKKNKVIKMMISVSSHVFLIGSLPFDHGTDPQDKFVPNVVENEHLVFSLIGLFVQNRP